MVGTALAAATGAQMLMSDVPTVVDDSILPNLQLNAADTNGGDGIAAPEWLQQDTAFPTPDGWAAATAMDRNRPVNKYPRNANSK